MDSPIPDAPPVTKAVRFIACRPYGFRCLYRPVGHKNAPLMGRSQHVPWNALTFERLRFRLTVQNKKLRVAGVRASNAKRAVKRRVGRLARGRRRAHRGRRPGRDAPGQFAARARLAGGGHDRERGTPRPVPAAAAVQGILVRKRRPGNAGVPLGGTLPARADHRADRAAGHRRAGGDARPAGGRRSPRAAAASSSAAWRWPPGPGRGSCGARGRPGRGLLPARCGARARAAGAAGGGGAGACRRRRVHRA